MTPLQRISNRSIRFASGAISVVVRAFQLVAPLHRGLDKRGVHQGFLRAEVITDRAEVGAGSRHEVTRGGAGVPDLEQVGHGCESLRFWSGTLDEDSLAPVSYKVASRRSPMSARDPGSAV